jgi:hypothetical protein
MKFTDLSDDELVTRLHDICFDARRVDVRLIGHLIEVEDRRLHSRAACSSLFEFCVRRLGMSEGAAFRRINAARLTRRFPRLAGDIESGRVHVSTLVLLRDHLTEANVAELVAATEGRSKRDVEELLARRAPRPDVPAKIRKLPSTPLGKAASPTAPPPSASLLDGTPSPHPQAPPAPARPARPARIEPLSEARYKMQLTVSGELRDKLERATNLMRHRNPTGDMAVVVERALDALLETLEKERLGKTNRPRRAAPRDDGRGKVSGIPAAVRCEVFARDGEQCTFVDAEGRRCTSRAFLELDHRESRALGGRDDAANLRVLCRGHNALHAEEVFGRGYVIRRIHLRQRKSRAESADPSVNEDVR